MHTVQALVFVKNFLTVLILFIASCNITGQGGFGGNPFMESGIASWYGADHHGDSTANGEIYDMESLTAAHRTLPFNSEVHVVNKDNGKTVSVRINNRGPFVEGRVIDLSRRAAREIDILDVGLAEVDLYLISEGDNAVYY